MKDITIAKNLLLNQTCDNCMYRSMVGGSEYCWNSKYIDGQLITRSICIPEIRTCKSWGEEYLL